ncbi:MAG: phosphate signaling complex protein PhoU [Oscillospiraceae bacterium]|nr:phosphate signaling complex protein PhoU [Oscillospiraceae bacterium]
MRTRFDAQLAHLNDSLVEMGGMVEQAIADANRALIERDAARAEKAIAMDNEIDFLEKEIESLCLKIIMQQQPVAGDLRLVSSVLKITTDLERIGDHAADISGITLRICDKPYVKKPEDYFPQMAAATAKMVAESIDAFVKKDLALARSVIAYDGTVNALFKKVKKALLELISQNADDSDQAIDLIMIAKYFERIGDHATNIAEWVIFSLTGMHKDTQVM